MLLPLRDVTLLFELLLPLASSPATGELCARVAVFIVRLYFTQLTASPSFASLLGALSRRLRGRLEEERGLVGRNLAALRHVATELDANDQGARLFQAAIDGRKANGRPEARGGRKSLKKRRTASEAPS